jgi:OOP family OmpA-OmpF porin
MPYAKVDLKQGRGSRRMMTVKYCGRFVLGGLAIFAATSAYADDSGYYASFDLGGARYSYANDIKFPAVTLSAVDPHIKDTASGIALGYRFIPYFGAEVGYVSLGKGSVPAADVSGATRGTAAFTAKGPDLALVGAIQVGYLEMFVKLGYLFASADLSVAATDGTIKLNSKVTASTPTPLGGAGLRYEFNERWHVKLEFDHYDGVGDAETTGAANINVATLGMGYRF